MGSLQGHDIVVVGGSRSVGRAIVETVWSEGATVLAVARGAAAPDAVFAALPPDDPCRPARPRSVRGLRPAACLAMTKTQALLVIHMVGAPTTPAPCIAFFRSSLLMKDCASATVAKSWVTVTSLGLSAA